MLEKMLTFVGTKPKRFDHYMSEHILGENGFYSERAEIGEEGHFTTMAMKPNFAFMIYLMLRDAGLDAMDILELGGGNGRFKRNYLTLSPKTRFLSVDASGRMAAEQREINGHGIVANAVELPFETNSLEGVVFSNELIDELPCRVFKITNWVGEPIINEEGYVFNGGSNLRFRFMEAERDEFLETYEEFLREKRPYIENGSVICVSPQTEAVLSEMIRVLKRGRVVIIDYGYWNGSELKLDRLKREFPFFREKGEFYFVNKVLKRPYEVDLTYNVDFEFLRWVAHRNGVRDVSLRYQSDMVEKILERYGLGCLGYESLLKTSNFVVMQFDVDKKI